MSILKSVTFSKILIRKRIKVDFLFDKLPKDLNFNHCNSVVLKDLAIFMNSNKQNKLLGITKVL